MIYICEYDGLADDAVLRERCEALLLPFDGEQTDSVKWKKHRERILARLLLAYALKSEYGLPFEKLGLCRTEHGKPYSSFCPQIRFNLSHCSIACAAAVGECETGIDIEQKFPYRANLARKICHPDERTALQGMSEEKKEEQLPFLWSLKESFVKWQGTGLSYGMDRINLAGHMPFDVKEEGMYRIPYGDLYFLLCSEPAYTLAVCSEHTEMEIRRISELSLIQEG